MFEILRFYIVYLALLSGITGLISLHKLPGKRGKFLVVLIWFSALTEIVGYHFTEWTGVLNYYVFNFYMFVTFCSYILLIRSLLIKINYKGTAALCLVLFVFSFILNILYCKEDINHSFIYSFAIGVLIVMILSCLYLIEIFNSDKILNFKKSVFFWYILGILVFHVPVLPFMLAIKWFLIKQDESVFSLVLFILNFLMHGCFIIGFLWSEKKYNY
ncbi:Membrane protein [Flavobacterium aquidurense]|uniref:Membrane protein n=1 Tax=Flavobacterium aquidurense TaxID=362413 RepID=A0A0Q0WDU4_9FLAO|nr:Membrane protein [Flavobacterium aquidurense]